MIRRRAFITLIGGAASNKLPFCCGAYVASWHFCDIARSQIDVRFRRKSSRAADITAMTEFDPEQS